MLTTPEVVPTGFEPEVAAQAALLALVLRNCDIAVRGRGKDTLDSLARLVISNSAAVYCLPEDFRITVRPPDDQPKTPLTIYSEYSISTQYAGRPEAHQIANEFFRATRIAIDEETLTPWFYGEGRGSNKRFCLAYERDFRIHLGLRSAADDYTQVLNIIPPAPQAKTFKPRHHRSRFKVLASAPQS